VEKNSIDYSAQARTNPVFMTAKTAVCLMAQAGIPDAAEIARRLGLGSAAEVSGMKDSGTLLGNELVVEAKYRTMCQLIEASGYRINVDLPCGYTPKALHLTAKGLRFIGLDLPIVAGEVGPLLSALADHPERMLFEGVDATNPDSLAAALKDVREPICLTTEGMMMYFTESEVNAVIANVRSLLEAHGGCWITPDPEYILQFMLTFKAVLGETAVQKLMASRDAASGQSDAGSLTNAFIVNPMDVPASVERVAALLAVHGLKARRANLAEHMPELAVYQKLTAEQVEAFKAAMRGCHYWVITPEEHWKGNIVPQTESAFSMDYRVADGVFRASLRGRIDTITAPELLKAWEAEKATASITAAEINCTRLQYISSAGLRVLLLMQKSGAKVRLTGVNDAVWEILETTGFIDIFEVGR
jgi:anti-anti-sigma factor